MKNNKKLTKNCNISNPTNQINTENNKKLIKNSFPQKTNPNETKTLNDGIFKNNKKLIKKFKKY